MGERGPRPCGLGCRSKCTCGTDGIVADLSGVVHHEKVVNLNIYSDFFKF